ncbi:hypothetical protein [Lepagella muris]|uniref:Uncharacterized protein n=1 Tax=Lepagella muris TaxID=3032870 RepID=A0AC61RHC0_9BACT|nr:hypothetical protein [Lepagella muris]TGY80257.1 hypothetical protein E5331_03195 [Lepagella muris]THG52796.1 hypothetical protein E5984_05675 [Bacteroidales bacterium]
MTKLVKFAVGNRKESRLSSWRAVSGLRVPARGGNANNGGNAGLEYLNVNNGVSTSNANYGSPLNFMARSSLSAPAPSKNRTGPHPKVKDNDDRKCR